MVTTVRGHKHHHKGGSGKTYAEERQYDATVEPVGKPTDRNLECQAAKHRSQHEQCDGLTRGALALHPRRNEAVEGPSDEPSSGHSPLRQWAQLALAHRKEVVARSIHSGWVGSRPPATMTSATAKNVTTALNDPAALMSARAMKSCPSASARKVPTI